MLRTRLLGCLPVLLLACSSEIGGGGPLAEPVTGANTSNPPGPSSTSSSVNPSGSSSSKPSGTSGSPTAPSATTAGTATDDNDDEEVPPAPTVTPNTMGPLAMTLRGEPLYARTVRLTHPQWERSVRQVLGMTEPSGQVEGLTQDVLGVHDFSNNEEGLEVSPGLWADYESAASTLAALVANDPAALARVYSGTDSTGFINTLGRRMFRRPLTPTEVTSYQELYDIGVGLTGGGDTEFARGAGLVLQGMLQSPNFVYRTELASPNTRLNGYEIAAKLSLLLRGTTPDDALLDAAERGELDTDEGIRTLATQMLDDPAAVEIMREYHGEMFTFNRFLTIEKDTNTVREYSTDLNAELQEAAYLFFDRIYSDSLGLREILTSTVGFVSPALAEFYDVSVPAVGAGFQEMDLGTERPGFFTQLPFLVLNSVNYVPDSIHRGVALNHKILCAEVPPPPDVNNLALPTPKEGESNRDRVNGATGVGTCGQGCHSTYINPLGFAFENFDGLGRIRDTDNGNPINTSETYPFVEGNLSYESAGELMTLMAEGEQAHLCYAKHLAGFALQRDLSEDDRPLVNALAQASAQPDSSIKQLLLTLVTDPAFTTRAGE